MSERIEQCSQSLSKSMREKRMPEMKCRCQVINKKGKPDTIERYARDFAELYYFLFTVDKIQKLFTYVVLAEEEKKCGKLSQKS